MFVFFLFPHLHHPSSQYDACIIVVSLIIFLAGENIMRSDTAHTLPVVCPLTTCSPSVSAQGLHC
ncbi:hypothetical protein Hanom_Chr06g00514351 [Helianthus anomalus]